MKLATAIQICLLSIFNATLCAAQNSIAGAWVDGYEINGN